MHLRILDVGCGNCRDAATLTADGWHLYFGVDRFGGKAAPSRWDVGDFDALTFLRNQPLKTLFDVVYMRWFLHAIPFPQSEAVFQQALANCVPGGLVCVEVRSSADATLLASSQFDPADGSHTISHKRWLYSADRCRQLAARCGARVELLEEGYFSPAQGSESENPLLIRFVCRRMVSPEQSDMYPVYRHISETMREKTMESYRQLRRFNHFAQSRGIRYAAVAGTALGLQRHGGIIPWDNDIDLGFPQSEWAKLLAHRAELAALGFPARVIDRNNHIHFGVLDCFLLTQKSKSSPFLSGAAGTLCHLDDWENLRMQRFGPVTIVAPANSSRSLSKRYGRDWFRIGNVNDNFHFKDITVQNWTLTAEDRSFQQPDEEGVCPPTSTEKKNDITGCSKNLSVRFWISH